MEQERLPPGQPGVCLEGMTESRKNWTWNPGSRFGIELSCAISCLLAPAQNIPKRGVVLAFYEGETGSRVRSQSSSMMSSRTAELWRK